MKWFLACFVFVLAIAADRARNDVKRLKEQVSNLETKVLLLEGKVK